jgi:hypothetical protein
MSTAKQKLPSVALVVLVALSIAAIGQIYESHRYMVDVRYAHDIVGGFHFRRDLH